MDTLKFPQIVRDQGGVLGQGMTGNPKVIGADGSAGGFKQGELRGVVLAEICIDRIINRNTARQLLQLSQHLIFPGTSLGTFQQLGIGQKDMVNSSRVSRALIRSAMLDGLFLIR